MSAKNDGKQDGEEDERSDRPRLVASMQARLAQTLPKLGISTHRAGSGIGPAISTLHLRQSRWVLRHDGPQLASSRCFGSSSVVRASGWGMMAPKKPGPVRVGPGSSMSVGPGGSESKDLPSSDQPTGPSVPSAMPLSRQASPLNVPPSAPSASPNGSSNAAPNVPPDGHSSSPLNASSNVSPNAPSWSSNRQSLHASPKVPLNASPNARPDSSSRASTGQSYQSLARSQTGQSRSYPPRDPSNQPSPGLRPHSNDAGNGRGDGRSSHRTANWTDYGTGTGTANPNRPRQDHNTQSRGQAYGNDQHTPNRNSGRYQGQSAPTNYSDRPYGQLKLHGSSGRFLDLRNSGYGGRSGSANTNRGGGELFSSLFNSLPTNRQPTPTGRTVDHKRLDYGLDRNRTPDRVGDSRSASVESGSKPPGGNVANALAALIKSVPGRSNSIGPKRIGPAQFEPVIQQSRQDGHEQLAVKTDTTPTVQAEAVVTSRPGPALTVQASPALVQAETIPTMQTVTTTTQAETTTTMQAETAPTIQTSTPVTAQSHTTPAATPTVQSSPTRPPVQVNLLNFGQVKKASPGPGLAGWGTMTPKVQTPPPPPPPPPPPSAPLQPPAAQPRVKPMAEWGDSVDKLAADPHRPSQPAPAAHIRPSVPPPPPTSAPTPRYSIVDELLANPPELASTVDQFPKDDRNNAFFDIDSLLDSMASQVDKPKKGILPTTLSREHREKTRLAKLGLEKTAAGDVRQLPKRTRPGDRDRAVEQAEREREKRARAERKRRQREAAANEPVQVLLPDFITVSRLADALAIPLNRFLSAMADLGFEDVKHDFVLNSETAGLVAAEFGFAAADNPDLRQDDGDVYPAPVVDEALLRPRPPVVTIMGHVDHGKTNLLDYLRKSAVAAGEKGGITQHIGAFSVPLQSGNTITFLDTPGHAAFLAMRQRGAEVTDIIVLVVAADDGVMPQTQEAIRHAQQAGVPLIVAISKMDLEQADPVKVKKGLMGAGVEVEDYGGDTQAVEISARTGKGMDDLESAILLLAEMMELKAAPDGPLEGWVVESRKSPAGAVATVIVRSGTLRPGAIVVAGNTWARVRSIRNDAGVLIPEAGPGTPAEIDGWNSPADAGDELLAAEDEKHAARVMAIRSRKTAKEQAGANLAAHNKSRTRQTADADPTGKDGAGGLVIPVKYGVDADIDEAGRRTIGFVIRADVDGSAEAVAGIVSNVGNSEVAARVVRSGIGAITPSDINFAATTGARLISFNVPVPASTKAAAHAAGIEIIFESVIYRIEEAVRSEVASLLPPIIRQTVTADAEIIAVFEIDEGKKKLAVAGCRIKNGTVSRNNRVRVMRGPVGPEAEMVYDGSISSLKVGKEDTAEVHKDNECGIMLDRSWSGFKKGDRIQCYEEVSERRKL